MLIIFHIKCKMLSYITPWGPSQSSYEENITITFTGKLALSLNELHNVTGCGQQNFNLTSKFLLPCCIYCIISESVNVLDSTPGTRLLFGTVHFNKGRLSSVRLTYPGEPWKRTGVSLKPTIPSPRDWKHNSFDDREGHVARIWVASMNWG